MFSDRLHFFGFSLSVSASRAGVSRHFQGCVDCSKHSFSFVSEMSHLGFGKTATEYFEEVDRLHHCRTFTLKKSLCIATFVTFQTVPECSAHLFVISRLKFPSTAWDPKLQYHSVQSFSPSPLRPLSFAFYVVVGTKPIAGRMKTNIVFTLKRSLPWPEYFF